MNGVYRIADKKIGIVSLYSEIHKLCQDYKCNGVPDFSVKTTQEDVEFEREKSRKENIRAGIPIRNFRNEYLETLAVYRKIAEKMIDYDTILFHGSAISVDSIGYLFTAKSGTGKSTHTRLWRELFGERAVMVNDDKPLIKVSENGIIVYGTPWNGKHRLGSDISVPLKAICILERSDNNFIEKIKLKDAYNMLVQQVYKSQNPIKLLKTLQLIDVLSENTGLYRLSCNMDISAAELAYNVMKG